MSRFFRKLFSDGPILALVMVSLTAALVYGLWIPRLGYYHDDWYMLWSAAARGTGSLVPLFSLDRPFMGHLYTVFYTITGDSIAGWHLLALLFRVAGAMAFYWILNIMWPNHKRLYILAAMVFVVFPGFLAQPNAATKINQLTSYAAALFSIAFTLRAARSTSPRARWISTALSMLLMALYLWLYEYMIGLEVMRLALLYWMHWQGQRSQWAAAAKKVLLAYIPQLAVGAAFLFWRVFLFDSTRTATDLRGLAKDYLGDFVGMALRLVFQTVKDFFSTTLFAWFVQGYALLARATYLEIIIAVLFTAVMVALAVVYVRAVRSSEPAGEEMVSPSALIWLGALIALAAVFPVVLSNRWLNLMDAYKAYALHPSAGVMIMVVGIILMMKPKVRSTALIALLALSVMTQTLNNQRWANFWDIQRNFWWQLTWRAPDIKDYTLVMAYIPDGYALQQDYEIWAPVNLIYRQAPDDTPKIQSEVLNSDTVLEVFNKTRQEALVRGIYVPRVYGNLLLISQPTVQSCIHVIYGAMPAYSASERLIVEKAGGSSNLDHIETTGTPPVPPEDIFGKEPERGWCYSFQQAGLARQVGDWQRIAALYDETVSGGLQPADPSEYFPFIEGLVNSGRAAEAQKIVDGVVNDNTALKHSFCDSLTPLPKYPETFGYRGEEIQKMVCGEAE